MMTMMNRNQQSQQQPQPNSTWSTHGQRSSSSSINMKNYNDISRRISDTSELRNNPAFASILSSLARSTNSNQPTDGSSSSSIGLVSNNNSQSSFMMRSNPDSSSSLTQQEQLKIIQQRQQQREREQQEDMMAMASMLMGQQSSSASDMSMASTIRSRNTNTQNATFDSLMSSLSNQQLTSSMASLSSMSSFVNGQTAASRMPAPNQSWGNMNCTPSFNGMQSLNSANVAAGSGLLSGNANPGIGFWSTASAELLGDLALSLTKDKNLKKKNGKSGRKLDKDRPKRPLSAYNIFFKEERSRILDEVMDVPDAEKVIGSKNKTAVAQDLVDGMKRDRANHPHGKIDFQCLAKIIGKRWKCLERSEFEEYKAIADADMKRYKAEMAEYQNKLSSAVPNSASATTTPSA
jgi:hypothetical protein